MNPTKYALTELRAERFPDIDIYSVAGDFWLADGNWSLLAGRAFKTRDAAVAARSKALDAANKKFWRA